MKAYSGGLSGGFGGETRDFRCIWVHVTVSWTREKCALALPATPEDRSRRDAGFARRDLGAVVKAHP
jgi:hypothetical protein